MQGVYDNAYVSEPSVRLQLTHKTAKDIKEDLSSVRVQPVRAFSVVGRALHDAGYQPVH